MKTVFLILHFLVSFTSLRSQKKPPAFGEIDKADLLMKECPFEPSAPAMFLIRHEETEFVNRFELNTRVKKWERIKIFNQAGYTYADVKIPFNKRKWIKNFEAHIYNIDEAGNIVKTALSNNDLFELKEKRKSGNLVFTLPHLKPGSIIEYQYTETDPGSDGFDVKPLQEDIPIGFCFYKLVYHDNIQMDISYVGDTSRITVRTEVNKPVKDLLTITIEQTEVSSFKSEPMMSSVYDNIQFAITRASPRSLSNGLIIPVEEVTDANARWALIGSKLSVSPFLGIQINASLEGEDAIMDKLRTMTGKPAKIEYLYKYVKDKIKWNNENGIYAEDIASAWTKGVGSSADINLALLNLLKKAKLDCYPVLVRYREMGKPERKIVSTRQFNAINALVVTDDTSYILDGTKKFTPFNTPPYEILNRDVLLIKDYSARWVTVYDTRFMLRAFISAKATVNKDGIIAGEAFKTYYDISKRLTLEQKEADANTIKKNEAPQEDIRIFNLKEENAEDNAQPLNHYFDFSYTPATSDNFIFINPFFLSPFPKTPFTDSLRKTDIDMISNQLYTGRIHFNIADHFEVIEMPQNILLRSEDSSMVFTRELIKTDSLIVFKYRLEVTKAIYPKEIYPVVRGFFQKMFAASKEEIILKLKK